LQLARYGIGGYYDVHQDPLFVYKDPNFIAKSIEATGPSSYNTGDRMSTLMFYLSDVTKGGYTAFPRLGVFSPPEKGSALFWHNIKRSGWSDMAMLHGGCPVLYALMNRLGKLKPIP
jgi:prolyl 4-hydroxylase